MIIKCAFYVLLLTLLGASAAMAGVIEGHVTCGRSCDNVLLSLANVPGTWDAKGAVVELDQKEKTFVPHVLPVIQGTTVRMRNSDPILHNIHAFDSRGSVFNIGIPPNVHPVDHTFNKPGIYPITCDVHPEMSAYVMVFENPFYTRPEADGSFVIRDVPPGTYSLYKSDPERKKRAKKTVTVTDGSITVAF